MSFVYMPIPGCSVHAERQLRAGLGLAQPVGRGRRAWRLGRRRSWTRLFQPSVLKVSLPVIVEHLYNLTQPSNCSLSLLFFNFIIILATCTFLTKFIVAIKVFYFPIHITLVSSP